MKIVGIEEMSPDEIRSGVQHGGSFALYTYCISLLVVSFKRPSDIYYIPPGGSRLTKGLPFVGISLLLGWWGIPWGIFYTIEALVKNLGGGIDVTDDILASLPSAPDPTSTSAEPPSLIPVTHPPALHAPAPVSPSPVRSSSKVGLVRAIALVAIILSVIWSGLSYHAGQNVPVALANGLAEPISVEIDGETHQLAATSARVITLAEGEHHYVAHLPHGDEAGTFSFSTSFSRRAFEDKIGLFNPDRLALFYEEETSYSATPDPNAERPPPRILHGEVFRHLDAPDYFFEPFPQTIEMSSHTAVEHRTRIDLVTGMPPLQTAEAVRNYKDHDARIRHLARLGQIYPEDEDLLRLVITDFEPEEAAAFFAQHLDDRPARVTWHRFHQWYLNRQGQHAGLVDRYRAWAEAAPEDGALAYLTARLVSGPENRATWYQRALAAAQPCAHAYNGMAFDAEARGDFATALDFINRARAEGADGTNVRYTLLELLVANGRLPEAIAHAGKASADAPHDFSQFIMHLLLATAGHPGEPSVSRGVIDAYVARQPGPWPEDQQAAFIRHCEGVVAGCRGDSAGFIAGMLDGEATLGRYQAALVTGDLVAMEAAAEELSFVDTDDWLLRYIAARHADKPDKAEAYFAEALALLDRDGPDEIALAARLRGGEAPEAAQFAALPAYSTSKRILLTAFGLRYPEMRADLFAAAERYDFMPGFPQHFLREVRQTASVSTPTAAASSASVGSL